ncbi:MAG: hypothetical protein GY791_08245 [Alphaproteobacteria bacterium]|nr:hypothetical protein [Alphaproteobacteria bacterium]
MGFLFPKPPPPPAKDDVEVQDAALKERRRRLLAAGRASTRLTGGQGVTGAAPSAAKRLLGE